MEYRTAAEELPTAQLRLRVLDAGVARALLAGRREEAAARLGLGLDAGLAPGWPAGDFIRVLHGLADPDGAGIEAKWTRALVHRQSGQVIGDLAFVPPDAAGVVELGYSLLPDWRRQGLMTEALRTALPWSLRQAGVRVVLAECDIDNPASAATLRRLGLRPLGAQVQGKLRWSLGRSTLSADGQSFGHGAGSDGARIAAGR